jgi:hypothetical protein
MNKKLTVFFSVLVILIFIGYIIFDSSRPEKPAKDAGVIRATDSVPDAWKIAGKFKVEKGSLKAVSVASNGKIYLGGDSFATCYNSDMTQVWNLKITAPVTSLCCYGDSIYATTLDMVLVINSKGELKDEWGPFEDNSIFTCVASNRSTLAIADAGNKMVFILDKKGAVKKLIGQNEGQFIIPSPYFDVALDENNNLFVANTGNRRIETRSIDGVLKSYFGEPGLAPEAFAGCCAPAHFILVPEGFVTAEKGLNRIKILNKKGEYVEMVSSKNRFVKSIPLDLASADGKTIYAANPADTTLYIFSRK